MSPGTRSVASTTVQRPLRNTRAWCARLFLSAASALAALLSCQKPTAALYKRSPRMTLKSAQSCLASEMIAATSIIQGIGPQKYCSSLCQGLSSCALMAFGPYCSSRCSASAVVKPRGDDESFANSALMPAGVRRPLLSFPPPMTTAPWAGWPFGKRAMAGAGLPASSASPRGMGKDMAGTPNES